MAYSSGMLKDRVAVMTRAAEQSGSTFGRNSAGRSYQYATTVWAAVDFSRGMKSMREGAYDSYDRIMVRMRWNNSVDRQSMLVFDGRTYQIESLHADYQENIIQITAVETPGTDLTGLLPVSSSGSAATGSTSASEPTTDND